MPISAPNPNSFPSEKRVDAFQYTQAASTSFKNCSATDASVVIADGVTELSANSQEVAASSTEGTRITTKAVGDMNQVKAALNNIYILAQNLRDEYNV